MDGLRDKHSGPLQGTVTAKDETRQADSEIGAGCLHSLTSATVFALRGCVTALITSDWIDPAGLADDGVGQNVVNRDPARPSRTAWSIALRSVYSPSIHRLKR